LYPALSYRTIVGDILYNILTLRAPLTNVRAYYTPENLENTPKIRWPGVRVRYNGWRTHTPKND